MKKTLHVLAGLVISGFCLWFTFRGFDFAELRAQAAGFRLGWTVPAAVAFVVAFALRIARWRWILSSVQPLRFWTVAPALLCGFLMNSVLPARGGEVARSYAISRTGGIPISAALGSVVVERTLDLFGLMTIMALASRLLPWDKLPVAPLAGVLLVLVVVIAAGTFLLPKLPVGQTAVAKKIISFIAQVGASFSIVKKPAKVAGLVLLSILIWMADAVTTMVLSHVALDLSFTQAAAVNCGIAVGVMVPGAPGYVGTYEFFGKQALVMLGFPAASALAFIVFLHFFQMFLIFLMGVPSLIALSARPKEKTT